MTDYKAIALTHRETFQNLKAARLMAGAAQRVQLAPASLAKFSERIAASFLFYVVPKLIESPVGRRIGFDHMVDHLLGKLPDVIR
jgi:hypothetical protein